MKELTKFHKPITKWCKNILRPNWKHDWIWDLVESWIKYNKNQAETQKKKINYCVLSVLECVIKFSSHFFYLSSYIWCSHYLNWKLSVATFCRRIYCINVTLLQVVKRYVNCYTMPILWYGSHNNKISYPGTHLIIECNISEKIAICN